jgi:hypothetical protein
VSPSNTRAGANGRKSPRDRIEKILVNTKGRLVVQHDLGDFKALPKFPAYLQ